MLRFEVAMWLWVCCYLYRIFNKYVCASWRFDRSQFSNGGCRKEARAIRCGSWRGAKLPSSPSISASHQSEQRESEPGLQAAALNNSRACYRTPLAACQYCLCLGLFPQLLAMLERLRREAEVLSAAHRRALSRHSARVHHLGRTLKKKTSCSVSFSSWCEPRRWKWTHPTRFHSPTSPQSIDQ